jgi:hypothetical protein
LVLDDSTGATGYLDCDFVASNLGVNGVVLMEGTVDDICPDAKDTAAVFSKYVTVRGRNYGKGLTDIFIIKQYAKTKFDDLVEDALSIESTEITYTSPHTAPVVDADFNKSFLQSGFVDAAELVGYDFTVFNDKSFQLWPLTSSPSSGVLLKSVPGDPTNNILLIDEAEVGLDRRNYIRLDAGALDDHWSEMNSGDWVGVNCTVADDTTVFVAGAASIRATITAGGNTTIKLTFPRYYHDFLDYTVISDDNCEIWVLHDTSNPPLGGKLDKNVTIVLTDTDGNRIEWQCEGAWTGVWTKQTFELGGMAPFGSSGAQWCHITGSTFNWQIVELDIIVPTDVFQDEVGRHVWIDGLKMPGVDVFAIAEDVD